METPETKTLPLKKLTRFQVSMLVNVGLTMLAVLLCRVLPPIGNPTPLEAKFIEAGYLQQEIKATQSAWWQTEIDQQDYNTAAEQAQAELSKHAEDLRNQLAELVTNEIPAYSAEDTTGAVPTADAVSASVTKVFQ